MTMISWANNDMLSLAWRLPQQGWEAQLIASTGMTLDQTRFALAFFASCACGLILRLIRVPARESAPPRCVGAQLPSPPPPHSLHARSAARQ
jgi:hypothetical protein